MRIRVGLAGAGAMGALHARVIAANELTELAWIAEPNRVTGRSVADRFDTKWLPEPDIADIDALVVATPTNTHHELASPAIDAGIAVLVEKPLAENIGEVRDLVEVSTRRGSVLMCSFPERFNAAVLVASEFIRQPVHVATTRCSPYVERVRTGVALDLLIHDVDLTVRLMREAPISLAARYGYFDPRTAVGSEDVAEATLAFPGDRTASLSASRMAQRKVRSLMVTGSDRSIEADLLKPSIVVQHHASTTRHPSREVHPVRAITEPLQLQLSRFVDLIRGDADRDAERDSALLPHVIIDGLANAAARSSFKQSPA